MDLIDKMVDEWIQKWKKGCLSCEDIKSKWEEWIPRIDNNLDKVTNPLETVFQKSKFDEKLITAFEKFIFYGYSKDCIDEMYKRGDSTTCDKTSTLNSFEYYFACTECEEKVAYRTLCGECFENSEHKRHKYQMLTSSCEYCCCGENGTSEEAWYCSKHKSGNKNALPEDVESRASLVMETIVQYIHQLLNTFRNTDECTDGSGRDDVFCVTVYTSFELCNDEYDHLVKSNLMKITKKNFIEYLRCLVQEGKFTITYSTKTQCETLRAQCSTEGSHLKAKIFRTSDVVLQKFISAMIIYLRKLLKYGKGLRRIFTKFILTPVGPSNQSVAEQLLIFRSSLPKRFLALLNELFLFGIIKEYGTKERFAKMLVEKYEEIITETDKNGICYFSEISHQLFTIPDLAQQLIANENILSVILTAFLNEDITSPTIAQSEKDDICEMSEVWSRYIHHLESIGILLRMVPRIWTKELRAGFLKGFAHFLRVLNGFQEILPEIRETKDPVEDKKAYFETSLILTELCSCMSLFLKWCESDNEVFSAACTETQRIINQRICLKLDSRSEKIVELLTYSVKCLPYDSSIHPVSFHLPLFRFFVGLLGISLRNCEEMSLDMLKTIAISKILDPVLKIQTRLAQIAAGMWKRNGQGNQIIRVFYCCGGTNRAELFDRDIQLLQMMASVTESNEFLIQILEKYNLIDWVNPNYEENSNSFKEVNIISSKFLQLLINVLVERHFSDMSDVTVEDCLKHELIHFLCIKPSSLADLKHFAELYMEPDLNIRLIDEIAVLKKPASASENGTYELRENLCDRYNPLFYHYRLEQMSEADEFQRQRRKAAGEPDCCPPSQLPKLKEFYVPMVNIFQCDVMLLIMSTVLNRFLDLESKSSSETQLEYVLYLIGYALQEEQSNRYPILSFTEKAAKWNLLECLEKILKSSREDLPKDLLTWTIRKYKEVAHVTTKATTTNVSEANEKVKKSQSALAKRSKMMEEMLRMQQNFMHANISSEEEESESEEDFDLDTESFSDATEKTCILCHETEKLGPKSKDLVMPGYFQYSTVLCRQREKGAVDADSPVLTSNVGPAIYTSSCGHVMHSKCLQAHLEKKTHHDEEGDNCDCSLGFDAEKGEFLCPFCESLSNTVLPLLPRSISLDDSLKQVVLKFTANFQSATQANALNVWKSLSYTFHVVETILRDSNKPILGHLSSSHYACLQYFTNVAAVATQLYPNDDFYTFYTNHLRLLLSGETNDRTSHLRLDMFGLLVTILFSEIDRNETIRFHTIRLVFAAQVVKTLIETDFDGMVDDIESKTVTPFKNILLMLGKDLSHLSESFIWTVVQQACLPFLRRCVLFFSFLTDDPVPVELTESGGDTFANMCSYLKFPQTLEELFDKTYVQPHAQNWFKHPDLKNTSTFEAVDPHHINQLIELPQEYFEICRMVDSFKCPNNDSEMERDPHLCLVCGEMICTEACCYEMIDGNYEEPLVVHLRKCSSGLYLHVDDIDIVFRPPMSEQSCSVPGPYLDEYHENQCDSSRINPQFLSAEKYKQLHVMWLNHRIFEKMSRFTRVE